MIIFTSVFLGISVFTENSNVWTDKAKKLIAKENIELATLDGKIYALGVDQTNNITNSVEKNRSSDKYMDYKITIDQRKVL